MVINNHNTKEQQWQLLVLLLKEIAIQKHGTGWQTHLAKETHFSQSNISRMFGLKYTPSFKNFLIIAKALKVNLFFEDQESTTDLNKAFESAMEALGRRLDKTPKN
jgi:DNA-binding phage protein